MQLKIGYSPTNISCSVAHNRPTHRMVLLGNARKFLQPLRDGSQRHWFKLSSSMFQVSPAAVNSVGPSCGIRWQHSAVYEQHCRQSNPGIMARLNHMKVLRVEQESKFKQEDSRQSSAVELARGQTRNDSNRYAAGGYSNSHGSRAAHVSAPSGGNFTAREVPLRERSSCGHTSGTGGTASDVADARTTTAASPAWEDTSDSDTDGLEEFLAAAMPDSQPAALPEEDTVETIMVDEEDSKLLHNVYCVMDSTEAERVVKLIYSKYRGAVFACDTEVSNIDVSSESPVGHGDVICFSLYCGPNVHWGPEPVDSVPASDRRSMLWVEIMDCATDGEVAGILDAFMPFFADPNIRKVWHNYGFDRHVLNNMSVECKGFVGDTMHMARLWDSSRKGKGYSLESLSGDVALMGVNGDEEEAVGKTRMRKLFGKPNIKKDGTPGKLIVVPPVDELQTNRETRERWIKYSAFDAKSTYDLYRVLTDRLKREPCEMDPVVAALYPRVRTLLDLYHTYWVPFGELLTDMETEGMRVDREHLRGAEESALRDQQEFKKRFRDWAANKVPEARYMNVTSGPQIQQLLFAGSKNAKKSSENLPLERSFKALNEEGFILPGKKTPKKHIDFTLWGLWGPGVPSPIQAEICTPTGWPAVSTPVLRQLAGKPGAALKALKEQYGESWDCVEPIGDTLEEVDEDGTTRPKEIRCAVPQTNLPQHQEALEKEASAGGYGKLYGVFGGGKEGLQACAAVDALCEVAAIDTLLSNFIVPLQGDKISTPDHRVHCSLNINTETGRLSARRPNLQNQPALEKDRYKVRKAFTADVSLGHTLIVADYGQLELRILAHMAGCASMIRAFELGGDFHSRTALSMYDHIQEAIDRGECLLEWEGDGKPPVALLKDKFPSERRKAKVLNFSIAYGKTAHGLAKDFRTTKEEAEETVNRWYRGRDEVKAWQDRQRKMAKELGYVQTILGRRRQLPDARSKDGRALGHALRAAINTPIQGSAADVVTAAMIAIHENQRLRDLGWKLLLQVHDEVILEGPKETAAEAQRIVIDCMGNPFNGHNPLLVDLVVDSKVARTWYEAK